jgi:hypothetical protein
LFITYPADIMINDAVELHNAQCLMNYDFVILNRYSIIPMSPNYPNFHFDSSLLESSGKCWLCLLHPLTMEKVV